LRRPIVVFLRDPAAMKLAAEQKLQCKRQQASRPFTTQLRAPARVACRAQGHDSQQQQVQASRQLRSAHLLSSAAGSSSLLTPSIGALQEPTLVQRLALSLAAAAAAALPLTAVTFDVSRGVARNLPNQSPLGSGQRGQLMDHIVSL
jgi:hypothetical protein